VAKRGRRKDSQLNKAAAGIGRTMAEVMNRMDSWRSQGDELAAEVRQIVAAGSQMLAELGHKADSRVRTARKALTRVRKRGGRPKGFKMSAAARRKLSIAAKKRWAARKAEKKD
jgi:hypothetical protein